MCVHTVSGTNRHTGTSHVCAHRLRTPASKSRRGAPTIVRDPLLFTWCSFERVRRLNAVRCTVLCLGKQRASHHDVHGGSAGGEVVCLMMCPWSAGACLTRVDNHGASTLPHTDHLVWCVCHNYVSLFLCVCVCLSLSLALSVRVRVCARACCERMCVRIYDVCPVCVSVCACVCHRPVSPVSSCFSV